MELARSVLARIDRLDSGLHSYATVMGEQALADAERAAAEVAAGGWRGPLHGVPVAVKDLYFTRGVRKCTDGSVDNPQHYCGKV